MNIDVRTCLESKGKPIELEHSYKLPQLVDRNKQLLDVGSVHFVGQGKLHSGIFTIKGILTGTYTLACSRCLAELKRPFSQEFEERFNLQTKASQLSDDEQEELHEVTGNQIQLLPFIEDEILLSIPFVPLCQSQEECRKNIPQKGKDWSMASDQTEQKRIDPRLADLAKFFDQNKQ